MLLIKLAQPAFEQSPNPSSNPSTNEQNDSEDAEGDQDNEDNQSTGDDVPAFNVMRVNTNPLFAINTTRFLRVKGFGLVARDDPLTGEPREMTFADLQTASCGQGGNDGGRRLCTKRDRQCGPCWGDTGAPLYDVDKSGTVPVLVGLVTFGLSGIAFDASVVCTSSGKPVIYTAVAAYMPWIRSVVGDDVLTEVFVPEEGIGGVDLAPEEGLSAVARVSIIVIATLVLVGLIVGLLLTFGLRAVRRRRKRWVEGLNAEESFVRGKEKDASIVDPFEGVADDHRSARLSINSLSRAAVKGATEFSAKSIGAIRALLKQIDEEDMKSEPRAPMEDAPQWLPSAWDRLFKPPSKAELQQIHKIPTQRVVDDVLEGADKSVEPSLDSVAFKNARDEANIELAWKRLEIQTSLRNLSGTNNSSDDHRSPPPTLSSSGKGFSWHGSKGGKRGGGLSGLLGSSTGTFESKQPETRRVDTLLAAFASIDAESEQVPEETMIDSTALRALAMAKRPNVLSVLRRKLSSGPTSTSEDEGESARQYRVGHEDSNRSTEEEATSIQSHRLVGAPGPASASREVAVHSAIASSSLVRTPSSMVEDAPHSGVNMALSFSGRSPSGFSGAVLSPETSRQNSMRMAYFSEDYSVSDSDSDGADSPVLYEGYGTGRRYTEDRPSFPTRGPSHLALRKAQKRSFEKLERRGSWSSSDSESSLENASGEVAATDESDLETRKIERERPELESSQGHTEMAHVDHHPAFEEGLKVEAEGLHPHEVGNSHRDSGSGTESVSEARAVPGKDSGSYVSVNVLRNMWNEIAKRSVEDRCLRDKGRGF